MTKLSGIPTWQVWVVTWENLKQIEFILSL